MCVCVCVCVSLCIKEQSRHIHKQTDIQAGRLRGQIDKQDVKDIVDLDVLI